MKIITGDRRSGKTTRLVQELMSHPDWGMVVHNLRSKNMIISEFPELRSRVFTLQSLENAMGKFKHIVADNIDIILHDLLGASVVLASATASGESLTNPFHTPWDAA